MHYTAKVLTVAYRPVSVATHRFSTPPTAEQLRDWVVTEHQQQPTNFAGNTYYAIRVWKVQKFLFWRQRQDVTPGHLVIYIESDGRLKFN